MTCLGQQDEVEVTVNLILSLGLDRSCIVLVVLLVLCHCPKKNMPELVRWPQEDDEKHVEQSHSGHVTPGSPARCTAPSQPADEGA